MADVIITLKIMPSSPEANLENIKKEVIMHIEKFPGKVKETSLEPVAFGLKALKITFISNEKNSNLDPLEDQIRNLEDVSSCEVSEVSRVIG